MPSCLATTPHSSPPPPPPAAPRQRPTKGTASNGRTLLSRRGHPRRTPGTTTSRQNPTVRPPRRSTSARFQYGQVTLLCPRTQRPAHGRRSAPRAPHHTPAQPLANPTIAARGRKGRLLGGGSHMPRVRQPTLWFTEEGRAGDGEANSTKRFAQEMRRGGDKRAGTEPGGVTQPPATNPRVPRLPRPRNPPSETPRKDADTLLETEGTCHTHRAPVAHQTAQVHLRHCHVVEAPRTPATLPGCQIALGVQPAPPSHARCLVWRTRAWGPGAPKYDALRHRGLLHTHTRADAHATVSPARTLSFVRAVAATCLPTPPGR